MTAAIGEASSILGDPQCAIKIFACIIEGWQTRSGCNSSRTQNIAHGGVIHHEPGPDAAGREGARADHREAQASVVEAACTTSHQLRAEFRASLGNHRAMRDSRFLLFVKRGWSSPLGWPDSHCAPDAEKHALVAELVALRREHDALRQELEDLAEAEQARSATSDVGPPPSPAPSMAEEEGTAPLTTVRSTAMCVQAGLTTVAGDPAAGSRNDGADPCRRGPRGCCRYAVTAAGPAQPSLVLADGYLA